MIHVTRLVGLKRQIAKVINNGRPVRIFGSDLTAKDARREWVTKKNILVTMLVVSLVVSMGTYTREARAQLPTPIDIDLTGTSNEADFPIGIECGDPDFVYVTIKEQGMLAKISKIKDPETGEHGVQLIDVFPTPEGQPLGSGPGEFFYMIARDPNTGNLFINENDDAKAWRFDPFASPDAAWTEIPYAGVGLVPEAAVFISNGIVFANGFIWIGLTSISFGEDSSFSGLVKVDPSTATAVDTFSFVEVMEDPETGDFNTLIGTMNVDSLDPSIILIPDLNGNKVFVFDTDSETVVDELPVSPLSAGSRPNHVATNANKIFVALNEINPTNTVGETVYLDADASLTVTAGDARLAVATAVGFVDGSVVAAGDPDLGNVLTAFGADEMFFDIDENTDFSVGETIYFDADASLTVTAGDARLAVATAVGFVDGSVVAAGDPDLGNVLTAFGAGEMFFDIDENTDFSVAGPFSEIAVIDRETKDVTILNTQAPNPLTGTFSVFVNNDLLVWTDQNAHVGIFDLTTGPPTPVIDEATGLPFFTTTFDGELDFDSNHFGCVPVDGEFWFASRGSAKVGILPNSKFSVGVGVGRARPTGSGGSDPVGRSREGFAFGDPNAANYDDEAPSIEEVFTSAGSLNVSVKIVDNAAVKDASIIVGKSSYPMKKRDGSPLWWEGIIPSSGTVSFKIVARDYNNNVAEYSGSAEGSGVESGPLHEGSSLVITPSTAIGHSDQTYSIIASGLESSDADVQLYPKITMKNTSNEPLKNIRLVLSPELKGKFLLSDYAIKSIAPNSEDSVLLKLNGNPNVDVMKEPIPYDGQIIVMIDNHSPVVLKLAGNIPNESSSLHSLFMKMIGSKAEQRYKTFEKPDQRISQDAKYQVTLGSGESVIKSASDELIITNNGDKPLKNLRIFTSSIADHFLPDQKNIALVPAGSFVKVKLVSNLNNAESRDLSGELLVVPENAGPVAIPIDIGKRLLEDKNSMYEVRTISGNDAISNTADGIIIRNNSEDAIDNLRIILPRELARVLSISDDSFKSIEPNSEKTVYLQPRGTLDSKVKHILNDYTGQIIIVSSDGMKKVIPVNIVWKGISSEHFVIYARDNADELTKATQVINSLERSYSEVTGMIDEVSTKTVIYMTSSLDELKMLSDVLAPSTYVFGEDVAFVWSDSEDVNMLALKEFAYRTIMQNYASYWTKQKISADNGNWLVDGISNYITGRIVGERGMIKQQLDAFIAEPESFEWYGASSTPSKHGASYSLFKFLASNYGDTIIDKILGYLGSAMIENHRCDTLEQCALLYAVYDLSGLDMDNKRYTLNFKNLVDEWHEHVEDNHSWG